MHQNKVLDVLVSTEIRRPGFLTMLRSDEITYREHRILFANVEQLTSFGKQKMRRNGVTEEENSSKKIK